MEIFQTDFFLSKEKKQEEMERKKSVWKISKRIKVGGINMQDFNYHQHTYRCGHADLDKEDEKYVFLTEILDKWPKIV